MKTTIFILSHNSPNNCITLETLNKFGYTGKWYIIIDNEDKFVTEYKEKYENNLIIFNKQYFRRSADSGFMTKDTPGCTLTARLAVEEISKRLHLKSFVVLDDDITSFKFIELNHDKRCLHEEAIKDFDYVIEKTIDYLINAKIACISYCTQNHFIGGYTSINSGKNFEKRVVSNCLIRNTEFDNGQFMCMYEDWCYSINSNKIGQLVFSIPNIKILVKPQHTQKGNKQSNDGNDELYSIKDYERNFLPILAFPNCVKLFTYNNKLTPRMNHESNYPKIISDKFKK